MFNQDCGGEQGVGCEREGTFSILERQSFLLIGGAAGLC